MNPPWWVWAILALSAIYVSMCMMDEGCFLL